MNAELNIREIKNNSLDILVELDSGTNSAVISVLHDDIYKGNALLMLDWHKVENCCQLFSIYVHLFYRNQGIGTAILLKCEEVAREHGCNNIGLTTNSIENPDAVRLYQRMGYEQLGEVDESGRVDMVKKL